MTSEERSGRDVGAIRQRLVDTFTPETLRRFCQDRPILRPIVDYFGPRYNLHDMIDEVTAYCETRLLWDEFLDAVDGYDPVLYAPAATLIPTPFNLPADLPDFTGRRDEMVEVRACLMQDGAPAMPIIAGMDGIGKTTLALHAAHGLARQGRYRDAQLFLDLKGTDPVPLDAAAALQALISAVLGPDPQRPADPEALAGLWRRAIHEKDAVLILDNAASAGQVRLLLPGSPSCAVLVTSCRRFAMSGAHLLDLDPMKPSDGRALLQTLAPRLTPAQAHQIVRLCGGLPLALRVAGNYLGVNDNCTPEQYAARLEDERARLKHLRDPSDPALDVEAAILQSVAQLDDDTRRAWALLALLPTPFDDRVAAAVWPGLDEQARLDELQYLRNRSLVSYNRETGRYHQHDLLHLAAARTLEAASEDDRSAARARLARHFLMNAQEVVKDQRYVDLDPDWPHLRAALQYAAERGDDEASLLSSLAKALVPYWRARGMIADWLTWCRQAADACAAADLRRDDGIHRGHLGLAHLALGDTERAVELYEHALAIARQAGDRGAEANWLNNLGSAYLALGQETGAIDCTRQALALFREIGQASPRGLAEWTEARRGEGTCLGVLGQAHFALGETPQAIAAYEQALAIAREAGDRGNEGFWLGSLGITYAVMGDAQRAVEYHNQALSISREIGDRRAERKSLRNLGNAYADLGQVSKAIESHEAALAIAQEMGDQRAEGNQLVSMGLLVKRQGDMGWARELWTEALAIYEAIEDPDAERVGDWLAGLDG